MRFRKHQGFWEVYLDDKLIGRVQKTRGSWAAYKPGWHRISQVGRQVDGRLVLFKSRKQAAQWLADDLAAQS